MLTTKEIDDLVNQIGPHTGFTINENGKSRVIERKDVRRALKKAKDAHYNMDLIINL